MCKLSWRLLGKLATATLDRRRCKGLLDPERMLESVGLFSEIINALIARSRLGRVRLSTAVGILDGFLRLADVTYVGGREPGRRFLSSFRWIASRTVCGNEDVTNELSCCPDSIGGSVKWRPLDFEEFLETAPMNCSLMGSIVCCFLSVDVKGTPFLTVELRTELSTGRSLPLSLCSTFPDCISTLLLSACVVKALGPADTFVPFSVFRF